jgi:hypothetical protein
MFQFKRIRDQEHRWDAPAAYDPGDLCENCYLDRNRIVTPEDHGKNLFEDHPFKSVQQDVRGRRFSTAQTPPSQQKQPGMVPATPKPAKPRDMTQADSFPKFPDRPQGVSEAWNDRHDKQLKEIPDPPPIKPDKPVVLKAAAGSESSEFARYRGLKRVVSAFQRAAQESWEEPKDYYHGTTEEDMDEVSPATSHRMGVIFPHQTDPEYAYATPSESNAWHYAQLAWNAGGGGIPRVYRVRPTGPVEEDPTHWPNGESRGNFSDDVRSRHPFEVHEELPTPEYWQQGDDEDWEA